MEKTKGLWFKFPFWTIIGILLIAFVLVYRGLEKVKEVFIHEPNTSKSTLSS